MNPREREQAPRPLGYHMAVIAKSMLQAGFSGAGAEADLFAAGGALQQFATAVRKYHHAPRTPTGILRPLSPPCDRLQETGGGQLLGPHASMPKSARPGSVAFMVPSIINPAQILDLMKGHSFAQYLYEAGVYPLVWDWGDLTKRAHVPTLDDLVLGDLVPAIEDVANRTGAPVTLIGYCMGGNLALAAALECREAIAQFAALATPWDFSAVEPRHRAAVQHMLATTEPVSRVTGTLSFDALQLLFSQIDPDQVQKKFARFSGLSAGSFAEQLFVAMEDWVNGGADLPADLARGCLTEWYLENRPQRGEWQVNGQPVLPQDLHCRSAVFVPSKDKIVPPTSALALGTSLPNANIFLPRAGHVGMMAGSAAKSKLWEPLVRWLTYKTEGVD